MGETRFEDKRWSVDLEHKILDQIDESLSKSHFSFNPSSEREIFVIDTPPPYPSGTWHIGAVAQYSMIDVIARSQRLLGKEVYFPWGVDRNGINIEFTVERKHNRKMRTFDRADFIDECRITIDEYTDAMRKTARRVGLSCDFATQYLTDSPEYRSVTQSIFVNLLLKGDIIEDLRPNLYDPVEGTTIADAEVTRVSRATRLVHIEWATEDGQKVIISTTRPELICACGIVLVHPEDARYTHLVGKRISLPMPVNGRTGSVEIMAHPSVKMDFGSGVLMVCSYGDQNDVSVFRELGLDPYQAIDLDGRMTDISGPLSGMSVMEARKKAVEILERDGKIDSIEERDQEIPVSERGGNPIEIILLKEWYVKQVGIQDRLEELVDKVRFVPERNKQLLLDWMQSISIDWPISRRRWYHTEIPIWYSEDGETIVVPPSGTYVRPWCESPPPGSVAINRSTRKELGKYEDLDLGELVGEGKVFDTWMDSSNSNLFVSGYGGDDSNFKKAFPTALRPQGKEIVRTWLYYTMLKSAHLLDSPAFQTVWIDGLGMDPWGRKMSKSWGNGIDADSVLDCGLGGRTGSWQVRGPDGKSVKLRANKIGSECFRLWKAAEAQVGDDFHINPEEIESKYFGVLTKIFNVARFASQFKSPESMPSNLSNADKWILSEYDRMRESSERHWSEIDIYSATQAVKTFLTGVFPSHWMEMAKSRLYDDDPSAAWTLHAVLSGSLAILSPVCPLFCHHLSSVLYGNSTMYENEYPRSPGVSINSSDSVTKSMMQFNTEIWRTKKERNLSLKSPLEDVSIPAELEDYAIDLQKMHSLV
tara:strand:- start:2108 stop:4561 length:2454 start_codon:yes stop_codon:yes gene_type:complete